jgi:hypothetical protein
MRPTYIAFDGSMNCNYQGYPADLIDKEDDPVMCELCELEATERVDLDPARNPGRYMVDLCAGCASFEKARINQEIRNIKTKTI